jgi:quinol monooxygenase YgiN
MITCTLRMAFALAPRDQALQVLRSLKGPVRSQPGCAQTLLMQDVHDDSVITWVSRWRSRDALDQHLRSTHFRRLMAVMELAAEAPDVVFEDGSELRGLDLIHEVIGGAGDPRSPQPTDLDPSIPT